ncbi:hypothetical protein C351_03401 [Cryptococcus neoformans c8]|nr:hypothetical protein C353_03679 [Cryptococcus neoformans var. grubii AD1-83a]OXG57758.1 hypothetical protein C354_03614 [Cryptococcus neoformans var. grubii MW-RSA1955]OXG62528.1 hypothetical protein C352_03626 [Cryptococcus neoformans var. grubii CHC193]OXG62707.1 hypothetical protein C351_03401 [Cryptococcus neoformans var. grubii c8]OXH09463.1 hypothetical protein C369_03654 [Cryptococcus neoformans var. grubii A5-35-17]OXH10998.1 hypothetical protein C370_03667 [Cryptococcus neoformans 
MKEMEQAGIVCKNETGDWKPDDGWDETVYNPIQDRVDHLIGMFNSDFFKTQYGVEGFMGQWDDIEKPEICRRAFKEGAPILLSAPKLGLRPAWPQSSSMKRPRLLSPPPDGEKKAKQSRISKVSSSSPIPILKPVRDTTPQSKAATSAKAPGKVKGRSNSDRSRTSAKRTSRDETASFAGRSSSSARRDALRNIPMRLGSPIIISTSSELFDQNSDPDNDSPDNNSETTPPPSAGPSRGRQASAKSQPRRKRNRHDYHIRYTASSSEENEVTRPFQMKKKWYQTMDLSFERLWEPTRVVRKEVVFSSDTELSVPSSDESEVDLRNGLLKRRKRDETLPLDLPGIYSWEHSDMVKDLFLITGPAYPFPRVISPGPLDEGSESDNGVIGRQKILLVELGGYRWPEGCLEDTELQKIRERNMRRSSKEVWKYKKGKAKALGERPYSGLYETYGVKEVVGEIRVVRHWAAKDIQREVTLKGISRKKACQE